MEILRCPVCGAGLSEDGRAYKCRNGHAFDISGRNYVNLLMSNGHGKRHGDDKLMVKARADFLAKGYYDEISRAVCRLVRRYTPNGGVLIDCGCGEGKYTKDICADLEACGRDARIYGIDISKDALYYGGRRCRGARLAVASAANMPFFDDCADVICELFSLFAENEFHRVLKSGGVVIEAVPRERHLLELKEAIYDKAYLNPPPIFRHSGFEAIETENVDRKIHLDNREDIENLFKMTPYYYKTGENDQNKLKNITALDISVSVAVTAYRKAKR